MYDDFKLKKTLWFPWFIQKKLSALRVNPYNAEIFLYKPWRRVFLQFLISVSFEYLCYGSQAIINILILSALGTFFICQNLKSVDVIF